jgi:hypothetical protein
MQYLLKLREPQVGELPDLDTTKGLVAHLFVQKLFNEYGEKLADEYQNLNGNTKQQWIDEAIQQKGAILLLPEYKLERQQFESILKESIKVLTSIIQDLHLRPIGSEVEIDVTLLPDIGPFNGSIDMVLENESKELVIFDFKWSEAKHYMTDLEENKAIQLELYRQAAQFYPGKNIAGVAYYLFPLMTLYTTDFSGDHIRKVVVKTDAASRNLFAEVQNSYKYRRDELDKGHIEDGEMTEIVSLDYGTDVDTKSLYPLDEAYNAKGLKKCPYVKDSKPPFVKKAKWDTKKSNPKEIKTTHPILKGRIV